MRTISLLIFIVLSSQFEICYSQQIPDGQYFGQDPPGLTPEVFAPDIISLDDRYEYILSFSPDLKECVFGITNSYWSFFSLKYTTMEEDSSWIEPITAPFQGAGNGLLPAYTQDGNKIFFISTRPSGTPNVWYSERDDSLWTDPVILPSPVNTDSEEFGLSVTLDDKLYFTSNRSGGYGSHDIYSSMLVDSQYISVENIGAPVNTLYNEASPYIAPDESYLIFESNKPGGYGQVDLYISFYKDSIWTEPYNLGAEVNTEQIEDGPFVSPDGKYLFFNRREGFYTSVKTDIYWIDASVIFDTSSTRIVEVIEFPKEFQLNQNFPNPFNPTTTISYLLSEGTWVKLTVYNILGQRMTTLVDGYETAGNNSVIWDGKNGSGQSAPSGIYIYRMRVGNFTASHKMLLMR